MVGIGKETEETDSETRVGEAAPEVLEEAITIDVQVCMTSFHFRLKASLEQRETGETIVTMTGGTLIDETGMIVEETTGGMTATAIGMILGIELFPNILKLSLLRG